jgi:NAD(P)H-nitrite reductase large subunit
MNDNYLNKQSEVICSCSGTTKAQIQQLILAGFNTMEQIANETGANTGCGSCDYLILKLLIQQRTQIEEN